MNLTCGSFHHRVKFFYFEFPTGILEWGGVDLALKIAEILCSLVKAKCLEPILTSPWTVVIELIISKFGLNPVVLYRELQCLLYMLFTEIRFHLDYRPIVRQYSSHSCWQLVDSLDLNSYHPPVTRDTSWWRLHFHLDLNHLSFIYYQNNNSYLASLRPGFPAPEVRIFLLYHT